MADEAPYDKFKGNPDLGALAREAGGVFSDYVRRAFELGVAAGTQRGIAQERERVAQAFQSLGIPVQVGKPAPTQPPAAAEHLSARPQPRGGATPEYGGIIQHVREALRTADLLNDSVTPQEVLERCRLRPGGTAIDISQVRTALKVLARRGEASRLSRGNYTASPKLLAPRLDPQLAEANKRLEEAIGNIGEDDESKTIAPVG